VIKSSKKIPIHTFISQKERILIENIAQRVSDLATCKIRPGPPCTDGETIFLPFNDSRLSYLDLEALATHEGGHIRFKSVIDPTIPPKICKKMPKLGQMILNICEDARIEHLLKLSFPGFWDEIDFLNRRLCKENIEKIVRISATEQNTSEILEILLQILSLVGCSHGDLIYSEFFRFEGGFKYKSASMKSYWKVANTAINLVRKESTFLSSVIASKKISKAIEIFIEKAKTSDDDYSLHDEPPKAKNESPEVEKSQDGDRHKSLEKEKSKSDRDPEGPLESRKINPLDWDKLNQYLKNKEKGPTSLKIQSLKSSGLPPKKLKPNEKHALNRLMGEIEELEDLDADGSDELLIQFRSELDESHEDIETILREMKSFKIPPKKKCVKETKIEIVEGNIELQVVSDIIKLKTLNHIQNPSKVYNSIRSQHFPTIYKLRSKFAPIKKSNSLIRGQRRGYISGRDLSQVRASKGNFNRPFKGMRQSKGARLILLIDESGSMKGSRIKIAKISAIIIAEALKNTQIEFSIIGFGAKSSRKVICEKVYTDFGETPSTEKIGTIGIANSFIQNRDGTSFRMAIERRISLFGNLLPILLIISDGEPCHGGTTYCGQRAIRDTRDAIKEITQKQIKVFALSIDSRGGSYLETIYGKGRYQIVANLKNLPDKLIKLVSNIAQALIK